MGGGALKIKVLGASGSEVPGHSCPAFLVDGKILLDAGTVAVSLNIREEHSLQHIFLTHAHFDHIKGIPFLLDNLVIRNTGNTITVLSGKDVLDDLKKNIFNDRIWPDFSKLPTSEHPVLKYKAINPARPVEIDGYRVVMEKVHHTVPAYGYIVENIAKKAIAYTGDTGPTERFWERMAAHNVKCLIVETSFPNRLEKLALTTGHLTPSLLEKEIAKMPDPLPRIYVMHLKPQYLPEIEVEIEALERANIDFLKEGDVIQV
jgi:cAMP phosphodiesterase